MKTSTKAGLIIAGGGILLLLAIRARKAVSSTLAAQLRGLTAAQRQMAEIIEREFVAAGMPLSVAAAAIVNALAESGLNPYASGDGTCSIGLFQLNACGGAGAGMSVASRQDPVINTRRIIQEVQTRGQTVLSAAQRGESVPRLAALFSTYVERPADIEGEAAKRAALARNMGWA